MLDYDVTLDIGCGCGEQDNFFGDTLWIASDIFETVQNDFAKLYLTLLRRTYQCSELLDKKMNTIGCELLVRERTWGFKGPPKIVQSFAHFREGDAVLSTNAGKNKRFDKVDEGHLAPWPVGYFDYRTKRLLSEEPGPKC
jgi:hypothetical protein